MFKDETFTNEENTNFPDGIISKIDAIDFVNDEKKIQFKYGLIVDKEISYEYDGSSVNAIFKNDAENFAILNTEQLADTLTKLAEKGINCNLAYLYEFNLSHNEHLIPDKLFYTGNESWFYDYYMFYKIKKMLHIIFPGVSALNNLGFYYCMDKYAPLFIVNNVENVKLCLAIAPEVYDIL